MKLEDFDSAEKDFLKYISLNKKNWLVYIFLGDLYFNSKRYQEGIVYYDLAIKYARKDDHAAQAHFMKGYSFFRMKKIDDACNNFKIASKLEGKSYQEAFNKYCNEKL